MGDKRFSAVFGTVLQQRRRTVGLSQEALADRAGVHRTYVGLVERGERNASLDVANAFAKALGVSLSEMIRAVEKRTRRAKS